MTGTSPEAATPDVTEIVTGSGKNGSVVERIYLELKELAMSFDLRPGERINEVTLARDLGVSRTPLREALNRLTADGFLTFTPGSGFYRRPLDVKEIFDLYELRLAIEKAGVLLAVGRASPDSIESVSKFLSDSETDSPSRTIDDLVALDEQFHERLMGLNGNVEMLRVLLNVNSRLRFFRWIDMKGRRNTTQGEHRAVLEAVRRGDANGAVLLLEEHIHHRLDQVVEAVKESFARLYVTPSIGQLGAPPNSQ
jgi:DNA-binding GntR family transcriptional regulator